jgi:hypothetical protein
MNSIHPFYRSSLAHKIISYIAEKRDFLINDLVAYSGDSVRYNRRFRMLIQLANYEASILEKIRDFNTDSPDDFITTHIIAEIESITNIAA